MARRERPSKYSGDESRKIARQLQRRVRYRREQRQREHQIVGEHSLFGNLKSFTSSIIFCIVMILNSS